MEKNEKKTEEFFGTDEQQVQQMESQSPNELFETPDEQPEKKHTFREMLVFLLVAVCIGVPAMLINMSCHHKKENQENYVYAYGEEPSEGHVSFKKNKSNIINPATKKIIVEDIDWCHYSSNSDEDPIVLFAKKGKRGFCNIVTDEVIVEPTTYTKAWVFSEGLAAVERNGYIGFVNTRGKVAIDFKFSYRGNSLYEFVFHDGYCVVADSSNKIGVIDKKGHWAIKPLYDDVELTKDYAIVYKEGDFKKQLDFKGHVLQGGIIDDIYDIRYDVQYTDLETGEPKMGYARNNNYYEYRVGSFSGLIDSKGKIITPPIYTDISGITSTLFRARLKDRISIVIIDTKGNVVSGLI